ncbi:TPA: tyrosine-type recombinase/integrase [Clostridioides difficile]|nr:tyrosine-type recombinase/integrase [Clostridioides difficile]HBF4439736.1 tyrosine-type recombinase/integrase [Clostridioides difficile]HBF4772534.1 tyrosine-type recombinase/integrase [Clostridioides difficile]HBF5038430.1 tyrosine-type recombinase/integrase [Clostridioides difficile]HBF5411415.1 tyrosine-type recombinase/integrase [Clostridioides difficile]
MISPTALQKSIKKFINSRGVYKTSLHLSRHTFITNAVNKNVSPLILQRITGHSIMKELNRYYNSRIEDVVSVIDDLAPKSNKKKKYFK